MVRCITGETLGLARAGDSDSRSSTYVAPTTCPFSVPTRSSRGASRGDATSLRWVVGRHSTPFDDATISVLWWAVRVRERSL